MKISVIIRTYNEEKHIFDTNYGGPQENESIDSDSDDFPLGDSELQQIGKRAWYLLNHMIFTSCFDYLT